MAYRSPMRQFMERSEMASRPAVVDCNITTDQIISAAAYLTASPYRDDELCYFHIAGTLYIQPAESEAALVSITPDGTLTEIH